MFTEETPPAPTTDNVDYENANEATTKVDETAEQQEHRKALEARYRAWQEAMHQRAMADVASIVQQSGTDEETAKALYKEAEGDIVDAIAMALDPAYATTARERHEARQKQLEEDIHDIQTCNTEVDPQTAIRRLRHIANVKDVAMQRQIAEQRAAKRAQDEATAASSLPTDGENVAIPQK